MDKNCEMWLDLRELVNLFKILDAGFYGLNLLELSFGQKAEEIEIRKNGGGHDDQRAAKRQG